MFLCDMGLLTRTYDTSMIGFYHVNTAKRLAAQDPVDIDATMQHYRDAADAYLDAAEKFPKDDEQHLCTPFC